ncbi:hypothetical protein [Actinomyces oricola]|uniref:hypothetical protein n=1 Tax=Actinomyces oricola TaxID=206043 RepID=UPI0030C7AFA0
MAQDRRDSHHRSGGSHSNRHGFGPRDDNRGGHRSGPDDGQGRRYGDRDHFGGRDRYSEGSRREGNRAARDSRGRNDERRYGRGRDEGADWRRSGRRPDRQGRGHDSGYRRERRDGEEYRPGDHDGERSRDGERRFDGRGPRRERDERRGERGRYEGGRGQDRGHGRDSRRDQRPRPRNRVTAPRLPQEVTGQDLEASARRQLRALGRANAENVARHLVMVQRLLDTDPQAAYAHARYAASQAGRIAVVRESAGIAAYLAGHYAEALRDIRAARRLSGFDLHRAIEADCERALGRHDQALKAAQGADPAQLDDVEEAEIAMVVSGIRHETGNDELGLIVIEDAIRLFRGDRETLRRLHSVRADRLQDLGRGQEAAAIRRRLGLDEETAETIEEEVEVFDLVDDYEEQEAARAAQAHGDQDTVDEQAGQETDPGRGSTPEAAVDADSQRTGSQNADLQHADEPDEDAAWSADFAQRVETEMAELLGEEQDTAPTPEPEPGPDGIDQVETGTVAAEPAVDDEKD